MLLANIRSSIFKRKYYKINSGFGLYEVILYFLSLFFVLYSYEFVSDILRKDPTYKSIRDVLQSFTEEQIAEDHYFTISNYYSCLKYSFFFIVLGFKFGERKHLEIFYSKYFLGISVAIVVFILCLLFISSSDNFLSRVFVSVFWLPKVSLKTSFVFLCYFILLTSFYIHLIKLIFQVKYYKAKPEPRQFFLDEIKKPILEN